MQSKHARVGISRSWPRLVTAIRTCSSVASITISPRRKPGPRQGERVLLETRGFMDANSIPLERREEYALVGIPVSTFYRLLDRERQSHPSLVEGVDPGSRYIYP